MTSIRRCADGALRRLGNLSFSTMSTWTFTIRALLKAVPVVWVLVLPLVAARSQQAPILWTADPKIIQPKAFYPGSELFAISVLGANDSQGGCVVKENGEISHYSHTPRGDKGSTGGEPHRQEVLLKIKTILSSLPATSPKQPPDDRKLVIHSLLHGTMQVFGYDRADAPDAVLELMRLSKCHIPSYTLEIPPDGNWQAHRHDDGSMAFLKRANQIVTCARYQPLRVWDMKTHELIREVSFPVPHMDAATNLAVSPDDRFIALTSSRCMIMDASSW